MLGRRGPAQAAFTSAELRELGRLDGVELRVDPAEVELDPVSERVARARRAPSPRARTSSCCASSPRGRRARTRRAGSSCASCARPVEIRGDGRVEAVDVRRNEIVRGDDGSLRARAADDAVETIEAGLVLRSVGYRAVPLPDVPFDERHFVLPNERGPRAHARRRAAARRLRRRLDQARADRHPRHQQARRRGDDRLPRGGPAARARCAQPPRTPASASTRCWPSARPAPSRPTAGARSTRSSASRAAAPSARA